MLQREVTQALGAALLPPLQAQPSGGIPWWVWLLVILVIVVLAFIWLRGRAGTGQPEMREAAPERGEVPPDAGLVERPVASAQEMAVPPATGAGETPKVAPLPMEEPRAGMNEAPSSIAPAMGIEMEPPPDELAPLKIPPTTAPAADDLTIIEGIGPRIADLLRQNGITTFEQLAQADVTRLREILQAARLGALADPATWPEQARLAAAGDWDQFEALTQRLRGGRQVEA